MKIWPNLFIVGAPKAGTTSLYQFLNNMPEIMMSKVKEPGFFLKYANEHGETAGYIQNERRYLKLFKELKGCRFGGEATSSYLYYPSVAEAIKKRSSDAKIFICIRHPVDRLFSHFLMLKRNGRLNMTIEDVITGFMNNLYPDNKRLQYLFGASIYYPSISYYINTFGRENVYVFVFEEMINDDAKAYGDVARFLMADFHDYYLPSKKYNPYVVPRGWFGKTILGSKRSKKLGEKILPANIRHLIKIKVVGKEENKPALRDDLRYRLIKYLEPDVVQLSSLLSRRLPWKDF